MMGISRFCWFTLTLALTGAGCRRPETKLSTPERATGMVNETANWAEKRRQGIDFVAVGSSPAPSDTRSATRTGRATKGPALGGQTWHLDIDFSKQMRFGILDGPDLLMPMPTPKPSPKGLGVVLDAQSAPLLASLNRQKETGSRNTAGRNRLTVSIEPVTYRDPVTKRDYAYTTRIETAGRQYVGGGIFIRSRNRLVGTWTLETFRGQRLRPSQFGDKALPVLTIDLNAGKLTGSTGWSKLKGDIRVDGDQLSISLKPARPGVPGVFEVSFLKTLQEASLFRVGKDRLTLLVDGQYVMTLRRS